MSMNVAGVSSYHSNTGKWMKQLISGKKINSAADDAAGSAIAQKLKSAATSANVNASNYNSQILKSNVADGAMSGMNSYLSDMTSKSVQASNDTLTGSDKSTIYDHMNVLSKGVSSLSNTTYNEQNVISQDVASSATPSGFDLSSIESATDSLYSAMAANGAASNAASHAANIASISEINQTAALSRIEDADMAAASVGLNTSKTLDQVNNAMLKKQMEDQEEDNKRILGVS
ncbi:flagellin [Butyrivibrio fibrisolvens]|uniref:flagellin n=1 Tax=Butyrivibrio fibrisolvens TaxID=831 RepID=UPI000426BA34|nr:flagellin [Butyrivibrio fibrisolvens]